MILAGALLPILATAAGGSAQQVRRDATVLLQPSTRRTIGGGHAALDRLKWFGGHWGPSGGEDWRPQDFEQFGPAGYRAHPGRGFVVSGAMSQCKEDPARPGFVDRQSLVSHCASHPASTGMWPVEAVDMIHSSKTGQLYANSCKGPMGPPPQGFMPGSHAATAEFFALFYAHCMYPTNQSRYLMEVANECNVKIWGNDCNTTWPEMVRMHIAVADAVHSAADGMHGSMPRPLICGPTAAFPQYEMNNFSDWRSNGTFGEFAAAAVGHMDCLSVHFYDTYIPESDEEDTDPFSGNFTVHLGGNLLAELDLQEAATARLSANGRTPMPLLVSEYGGGFKGTPRYTAGHDWWVLRAVTGKLMHFLDRPDRILKALPFIVGKATWNAASKANNGSHSYPWLLWRTVTPTGADPESTTVFLETHLHKWFELFADLDGERFLAHSDDATVQVQAFRSANRWQVVLNNLAFSEDSGTTVQLHWDDELLGDELHVVPVVSAQVQRLHWNETAGSPLLDDQTLPSMVLPTQLELRPAEALILTVETAVPLTNNDHQSRTVRTVDETTFYSERILHPLPSTKASAEPYLFTETIVNSSSQAVTFMRVRVGFGGTASSLEDSEKAYHVAAAAMNVEVDGVACTVDYSKQVAGPLHINKKDFTYLTAIDVDVPMPAASTADRSVLVWSEGARDTTVTAVVLVVGSEASDVVESDVPLKSDDASGSTIGTGVAECLDVKTDCGARGDGKGDDTAAFQRCVATAHCCGGCIRVAVGIYPLTSVAINVSDLHVFVDAGTVLRTPAGYESGPAGGGILVIGGTDAAAAHNVSIVGMGGQFVVDCTRQADIGSNRVAALRLHGNVRDFVLGNIRTKMKYGPETGAHSQDLNTNAIAMGNVLVDGVSYHPTGGHVYNITNSGSWGGYGLVQVQSAEDILFEHLDSTGGVTLRMETGVQLPGSFVGNITGRHLICRDGSSGFLASPHSQHNGNFFVYDVQSFGCFMGIHLVAGYVQEQKGNRTLNATVAGFFGNGSRVHGVVAHFQSSGAQCDAHCQLSKLNGSSCAACAYGENKAHPGPMPGKQQTEPPSFSIPPNASHPSIVE
eukprot:SAG11_NODE_2264_length_3606_cov_1.320217_1_plen_1087_part_00